MLLFEMCRAGDSKALSQYLRASATTTGDVNHARYCDYIFTSPLMIAARGGHEDCVDLLLQHGANVLHQNENGDTALHWASIAGHAGVVECLLDAGKKRHDDSKQGNMLNVVNSDNCTALMLAAHYNRHACVNAMLTRNKQLADGIDFGVKDHNTGLTALDSAVQQGSYESILPLLHVMQTKRKIRSRL